MNSTGSLKEKGLLRQLVLTTQKGRLLEHDNKDYLNLSSNDYLGISAIPELQEEFIRTLPSDHFLMGSLSSRLLTGNSPAKENLENYLTELYGRSCLLFNSGYHANTGILPAIAEKGDLILADKLIHASLIDALKLSNCQWQRFRHNDPSDLEKRLKQAHGEYNNIYVVTESIFSMDGDCADLQKLIELKEQYRFYLYVDEAHAAGIRGNMGLGLAEEKGVIDKIDFLVVTLGKGIASEGAFVICNDDARKWLINTSRPLIFSTATSPISTLWTHFIFKKIIKMQAQREHLHQITSTLREHLKPVGLLGDTHIIPVVMPDNNTCLEYAKELRDNGIWSMPVRYPSVPKDSPRIRLSLTAALTDNDIRKVYETILAQSRR